jgi:hypothetical protein
MPLDTQISTSFASDESGIQRDRQALRLSQYRPPYLTQTCLMLLDNSIMTHDTDNDGTDINNEIRSPSGKHKGT